LQSKNTDDIHGRMQEFVASEVQHPSTRLITFDVMDRPRGFCVLLHVKVEKSCNSYLTDEFAINFSQALKIALLYWVFIAVLLYWVLTNI
jgi:hypothetical protein